MVTLIINSLLLGVALAVDAISVSVADGLSEPGLKTKKLLLIAVTFGAFQAAMPLVGYALLKTLVSWFEVINVFVPYIALALLTFLGVKTIVEGVRKDNNGEVKKLSVKVILLQGVATSIDALSVGLTFSGYSALEAIISALIIGFVTFALCTAALKIGNKISAAISWAHIAAGVILIAIGIEILIKSFM